MAHDVFISHSSKDKPIADAVCAKLESQGVRCWVAPRDILPGADWGDAIVQAISHSRAMILIFSSNANQSHQIKREVERAASKEVMIIPFRIEDVLPSGALEYYLGTPHWLDALTPPLERHLQRLSESVKQLLSVTDPQDKGKAHVVEAERTVMRPPTAFAPPSTSPHHQVSASRPGLIKAAVKGAVIGAMLGALAGPILLFTVYSGQASSNRLGEYILGYGIYGLLIGAIALPVLSKLIKYAWR